MCPARTNTSDAIDTLMNQASAALVARRYFECERLCVEALEHAFRRGEFAQMARILLPLQESRRFKRHLAIDSGKVFVIDSQVPMPGELETGLYLIQPPRVGLDGRLLRETCDRAEIPAVIVVREPTTRGGQCPIVSLGPVTTRARVEPPRASTPATKKSGGKGGAKAPASKTTKRAVKGGEGSLPSAPEPEAGPGRPPSIAWMLSAAEALGDAAIADIDPTKTSETRVEELYLRLQANGDHEKLHQALAEACIEAARDRARGVAPKRPRLVGDKLDDLDADDADESDEADEADELDAEPDDERETPEPDAVIDD